MDFWNEFILLRDGVSKEYIIVKYLEWYELFRRVFVKGIIESMFILKDVYFEVFLGIIKVSRMGVIKLLVLKFLRVYCMDFIFCSFFYIFGEWWFYFVDILLMFLWNFWIVFGRLLYVRLLIIILGWKC